MKIKNKNRIAKIQRTTRETDISMELNIDGTGAYKIETPIPFVTHMLEQLSRHGKFDLKIKARGDVEIDEHHTVEDLGISLGEAFYKALGSKEGIVRFGEATVPLDEALVQVVVDFSGRPYLVRKISLRKRRVGRFDTDLLEGFFQGFVNHARVNLHIRLEYGMDPHHVTEATFKAFAQAVDRATRLDPRIVGIPSTKGVL
ncbi:MAG: imidazoleglycerol-phosphate dehydratase HisB [Deltaproteobacteria bacterium]|nr:imidazoleglycerol-phosphate dehydratase HisB [Deltaproteobacteria bacterium]